MASKKELIIRVRKRLGEPMIKVELHNEQISDFIDEARDTYIKWAIGQATQEVYMTLMLEPDKSLYELPGGIIEVMSYDNAHSYGGINTLFTIDNYLYNNGMYDGLMRPGGETSIVNYHIALDFLSTMKRYRPDKYNWKYHLFTNQLEIQPTPKVEHSKEFILSTGENVYTCGWILLKTVMIMSSSIGRNKEANTYEFDNIHITTESLEPSGTHSMPPSGDDLHDLSITDDLYNKIWILNYTIALCKISLGMIRRKFSGFQSLGNQGISLDGDSLVSEGKEEKRELLETLKTEEPYEGMGIIMG